MLVAATSPLLLIQ